MEAIGDLSCEIITDNTNTHIEPIPDINTGDNMNLIALEGALETFGSELD